MRAWIGVALDATLAVHDRRSGPGHIGPPIPSMVNRVRMWRASGMDVRIFTPRVAVVPETDHTEASATLARKQIEDWCRRYLGEVLPVTALRDHGLIQLWDASAVQLVPNSGQRVDGVGG